MTSHLPIEWLSERREGETVVARIGRQGSELVAEFGTLAVLRAARNGTSSSLVYGPDADRNEIEKLSSGVIHALLRHLHGQVTLHGSAVAVADCAFAIVGGSGAGKSTLATALCLRPGVELLADDTVAIDIPDAPRARAVVQPTQTGTWLLPDVRQALGFVHSSPHKTRIGSSRARKEPTPLRSIIAVGDEPGPSPRLFELRGQAKFAALAKSVIRFVIDDPAAQQREFAQLVGLAESCPVFELRRPSGLAGLQPTVDQLEAYVRQSSEGAV
jgi:hypothetical protein